MSIVFHHFQCSYPKIRSNMCEHIHSEIVAWNRRGCMHSWYSTSFLSIEFSVKLNSHCQVQFERNSIMRLQTFLVITEQNWSKFGELNWTVIARELLFISNFSSTCSTETWWGCGGKYIPWAPESVSQLCIWLLENDYTRMLHALNRCFYYTVHTSVCIVFLGSNTNTILDENQKISNISLVLLIDHSITVPSLGNPLAS